MRRRDFMTILVGAAACPTLAGARDAMPVIGYLGSTSAGPFAPFQSAGLPVVLSLAEVASAVVTALAAVFAAFAPLVSPPALIAVLAALALVPSAIFSAASSSRSRRAR